MAHDDWKRIADLAERQAGVISRAQLDAAAIPDHRLRAWVAARQLEKVAPRVWRVVGSARTWEQRLHTGLLCLGPRSWVSHEAAAQLHGFDRTPADRVEFLVLRGQKNVELGEIVRSSRRWGPSDAVVVDGFRVTSATRTILDLANVRASPDRIAAAIDSAVRLQLSSPETLRTRLDVIRSRGRAGVAVIERLLEYSGGHTMLERRFLELIDRVGLPRPETQAEFRDPNDDHFVARVDFYFRSAGLVVEVTGKVGHSTPEERARDAQRRNELQELGVRVFEFTWEDVTERGPYVISQMRRLLLAHLP